MSTPSRLCACCLDGNGTPTPDATLNFLDKDRIFNPTNNPLYANDLGLPSLLLRQNVAMGITHLHFGPKFGGKHTHKGVSCAERDTLVMEVGGRQIQGKSASARWFAEDSQYNRQGFASNESVDAEIISTTCVGCNTIRDIVAQYPRIKKAFIMTSSEALIEGCFDAMGVEVKFWKVAPEYITGATFQSECALLNHFNAPPTANADTCSCRNCMDEKQLADVMFAKYGNARRKDNHGIQLATKYGQLKKGEKFVITNNADVHTPTVIMRVDDLNQGQQFFGEIGNLTPGKALEGKLNREYGPETFHFRYDTMCNFIRIGLNEIWIATA
ncbi:hypothetical protein EG329_003803 [Mollisiaceae sp. DMI_Dod_QoI]|nr:hypothetical protein EG329_003803 [Helotiales sp. DMI_Dod_QoI]